MADDDPSKEAKPANEAKPAPKPDDRFPQVTEGAKRYRETAKWLISGFAALGAALTGSLSIASVAGASLIHNWYAVVGFLVAIGGCILAMASGAYTLASSRFSSRELLRDTKSQAKTTHLQEYAEEEHQFYFGFSSIQDLLNSHEAALTDRNKAFLSGDASAEKKATRTLKLTQPLVTNAITYTSFEQLRLRFLRTVWGVVVGVTLAAIGALIFAAGVPEDAPKDALANNPVYAQLSINSSAHDRYAEALGPNCDVSQLLVVVLSSDSDSYDVLASSTNDSCPLALMSVDRDEGSLEPCSSDVAESDGELSPSASPSATLSPSLSSSLNRRSEGPSVCDFDDPPDIVIIRDESRASLPAQGAQADLALAGDEVSIASKH